MKNTLKIKIEDLKKDILSNFERSYRSLSKTEFYYFYVDLINYISVLEEENKLLIKENEHIRNDSKSLRAYLRRNNIKEN
jgi:hypothetical protein